MNQNQTDRFNSNKHLTNSDLFDNGYLNRMLCFKPKEVQIACGEMD